jgi:large conductance mechanosensitive channel
MAKKNKTNLLSEFKAFITKGNVIDMAVGVIIGAAFGKIVSSFVNDILMPLIGLVMGKVNFHDLKWILATDAEGNITSSVNYGTFLQGILDFLIIAACVFLLVRLVALVRSKAEEAKQKQKEEVKATPPAPSEEQVLLTEIRDLLKEKK